VTYEITVDTYVSKVLDHSYVTVVIVIVVVQIDDGIEIGATETGSLIDDGT